MSANSTLWATSSGRLSLASGPGLYCSSRSSKNAVCMPPGMSSVTPTSPLSSLCSARVKPTTPNLLAQYAVASGKTRWPRVQATVTTLPPRGLEVGQRGAHHGRGAEQVDHDDLVPVVTVDVDEGAALVGAGGGEDGVEAAARAVDEALDGRLGSAGVGEVDDLVRDPVDGDAVEDEHAAAGVAHGGGGGGAEAAGGPGHEDGLAGHLAVLVSHGSLLP